jgi:predicted N-acyltransferase
MVARLASIRDIAKDAWDGLANPPGAPHNPLVSHDFFRCLEDSGAATAKTGWAPCHHVEKNVAGAIAAVAPCYLKSHSLGEYVFDQGWAEAFNRAGGRYYPKLQVAVPFTPVTGPRLMAETPAGKAKLAEALVASAGDFGASSVHVTFLPEAEARALAGPRWLLRTDIQFQWHNRGFRNFAEFLTSLASAKRKNIRRERESLAGIDFARLTGRDITEAHWDAFHAFYMDTGSRKWGRPYLNRAFFSLIGEAMADRVLLVIATRAGRPIAGALNFIGGDALYGRNWGAIEHHPNLHFETCYYQAIEFAIERGLARVEAGAQGPHKLARGYLPVTTFSLHHLAHRGLAAAVDRYLAEERASIAAEAEALARHAPFRHEEGE